MKLNRFLLLAGLATLSIPARAVWTQTSYTLVVKNIDNTAWVDSNMSGYSQTFTNPPWTGLAGTQSQYSIVSGDARDYPSGPNWDSPWGSLVPGFYVSQSWSFASVTVPNLYTYWIDVAWQETVGDESWEDGTQSPTTASRHADLWTARGVTMQHTYNGTGNGGGGGG